MLKHIKPFALVTAAALAVTSFGLSPATARPATGLTQTQKAAPITEFSSRARYRSYPHYGYHRNNGAALGTFLAIAGSVAAVAAASHYRHRHYGYQYGYGGGPYYGGYGGGPYGYYGGGRSYGW